MIKYIDLTKDAMVNLLKGQNPLPANKSKMGEGQKPDNADEFNVLVLALPDNLIVSHYIFVGEGRIYCSMAKSGYVTSLLSQKRISFCSENDAELPAEIVDYIEKMEGKGAL